MVGKVCVIGSERSIKYAKIVVEIQNLTLRLQ